MDIEAGSKEKDRAGCIMLADEKSADITRTTTDVIATTTDIINRETSINSSRECM